jgi:hypothetical protein
MEDKKKKIIILIILTVIAVFSIRRNMGTTARGPGAADHERGALRAEIGDLSSAARDMKRSELESFGRNPFKPASIAKAATRLVLSGILWDSSRPSAIINGEIAEVGTEVSGSKIVKITRHSVTLHDGKKYITLTIEE